MLKSKQVDEDLRFGGFDENDEDDDEKILIFFMRKRTELAVEYAHISAMLISYSERHPQQLGLHFGPKFADIEKGAWLYRCLNCPNPNRMKEEIGVYPATFFALFDEMCVNLFPFERSNKELTARESLAIFLVVLITGSSFRTTARTFCRPKSSIAKAFWKCVSSFLEIVYDDEVNMLFVRSPHPKVLSDARFRPFGNVIGADTARRGEPAPRIQVTARHRQRIDRAAQPRAQGRP